MRWRETADAGGSNGYRVRAWKFHLAALAAETGLAMTVLHYPPGTSKWNTIEHRLLSFISMNWRGRPLISIRTIIELIGATTTQTGLTVTGSYEPKWYPKGVKITDAQMTALPYNATTGTATGTTPSPQPGTHHQTRGEPLLE